MNKIESVKAVTETLVRKLILLLIKYPQHLEMSVTAGAQIISVKVRAHRADTQQLIGGSGGNFRPLSTLLMLIGSKHGMAVNLKRIADPIIGDPEHRKFQSREVWNKEAITEAVELAAKAVFEHPEFVKVRAEDSLDSSIFTVTVATNERTALIKAFFDNFGVVLDGIGKSNGRILELDVEAKGFSDPAQPGAPDGRFAKAA